MPIAGNIILTALQVVAQKQVKHSGSLLHILGHNLDEAAGVRVHGRQPHHIWVILTQALGSLDIAILSLQLGNHRVLLGVRVGKPGVTLADDLKQGRLGDIDIALLDEGGGEPVEHREDEGADLEPIHIGVRTDDYFVPS